MCDENCAARARMMRRDLLNAYMTGAAKHAIKGLAEMVGLSEKTGAAEEAEAKAEPASKPARGKPDGELR